MATFITQGEEDPGELPRYAAPLTWPRCTHRELEVREIAVIPRECIKLERYYDRNWERFRMVIEHSGVTKRLIEREYKMRQNLWDEL